jgi:hypothetical protein
LLQNSLTPLKLVSLQYGFVEFLKIACRWVYPGNKRRLAVLSFFAVTAQIQAKIRLLRQEAHQTMHYPLLGGDPSSAFCCFFCGGGAILPAHLNQVNTLE